MPQEVEYLGVSLSLAPTRRVQIQFRTDEQARKYHAQVQDRSIHERRNLKSQLNLTHKTVSLRLPPEVIRIEASTRFNGFYLVFDDEDVASDWVRGLLVWRFVRRTNGTSKTEVYVWRDVGDKQLNEALGIRPEVQNHIQRLRDETPSGYKRGRDFS